jgi:hypothetical protein
MAQDSPQDLPRHPVRARHTRCVSRPRMPGYCSSVRQPMLLGGLRDTSALASFGLPRHLLGQRHPLCSGIQHRSPALEQVQRAAVPDQDRSPELAKIAIELVGPPARRME